MLPEVVNDVIEQINNMENDVDISELMKVIAQTDQENTEAIVNAILNAEVNNVLNSNVLRRIYVNRISESSNSSEWIAILVNQCKTNNLKITKWLETQMEYILSHLKQTEATNIVLNLLKSNKQQFVVSILSISDKFLKLVTDVLNSLSDDEKLKLMSDLIDQCVKNYNAVILRAIKDNFSDYYTKIISEKSNRQAIESLLSISKENSIPLLNAMSQYTHGLGKIDYQGGIVTCAQINKRKNYFTPTLVESFNFNNYLKLIKSNKPPIRDRFIITGEHWMSGEIQINEKGEASILIIDSLGAGSLFKNDIINEIDTIIPNAKVYYSSEERQFTGKGCSVYAIDDARNLCKLNKFLDKKYQTIFEYLDDHIDKSVSPYKSSESSKLNVIYCKLPLKFQSMTTSRKLYETIESRGDEKELPITSRGETAKQVADKDFIEVSGKKINDRLNRKFNRIGKMNATYLMDCKDINSQVKKDGYQFTLEGLPDRINSSNKVSIPVKIEEQKVEQKIEQIVEKKVEQKVEQKIEQIIDPDAKRSKVSSANSNTSTQSIMKNLQLSPVSTVNILDEKKLTDSKKSIDAKIEVVDKKILEKRNKLHKDIDSLLSAKLSKLDSFKGNASKTISAYKSEKTGKNIYDKEKFTKCESLLNQLKAIDINDPEKIKKIVSFDEFTRYCDGSKSEGLIKKYNEAKLKEINDEISSVIQLIKLQKQVNNIENNDDAFRFQMKVDAVSYGPPKTIKDYLMISDPDVSFIKQPFYGYHGDLVSINKNDPSLQSLNLLANKKFSALSTKDNENITALIRYLIKSIDESISDSRILERFSKSKSTINKDTSYLQSRLREDYLALYIQKFIDNNSVKAKDKNIFAENIQKLKHIATKELAVKNQFLMNCQPNLNDPSTLRDWKSGFNASGAQMVTMTFDTKNAKKLLEDKFIPGDFKNELSKHLGDVRDKVTISIEVEQFKKMFKLKSASESFVAHYFDKVCSVTPLQIKTTNAATITIDGKNIASLLADKKINTDEELKDFFKKQLLSKLPESAQDTAADYLLKSCHQSGLLHPVSSDIYLKIFNNTNQKYNLDPSSYTRETHFTTNKLGLYVEESVNVKSVTSIDRSTEIKPTTENKNGNVIEANAKVLVDFSNPKIPNVSVVRQSCLFDPNFRKVLMSEFELKVKQEESRDSSVALNR